MEDLSFEFDTTPFFLNNEEIHHLKIFCSISDTPKFHLTSLYFTLRSLSEDHKPNKRPPDAEIPRFPSLTRCYCLPLSEPEQKQKLSYYLNDINIKYLIGSRFNRFLKTLNFEFIKNPFAPLNEIRAFLQKTYQINTEIKNPLQEAIKKPIYKISTTGQVLYDHGPLPFIDRQGADACSIHLFGLDEDSAPTYCLKKYNIQSKGRFREKFASVKQYLGEYSVFVSRLNHPNIIEYHEMLNQRDGVTGTITQLCVLMRYCNRGSLKHFLSNKALSEEEAETYFRQVLAAFQYLQEHKITHGDLKPENVLVHENNGKITLKLADFGSSQKIFQPGSPMFRDPIRSLPYCAPQFLGRIKINKDGKHSSELICKELYSDKCDIWSLGVLLFYMIFRTSPWGKDCDPDDGENQVVQALKLRFEKDEPEIEWPRKLENEKLAIAIRRMLLKDERKRIEWKELFEMFRIRRKKSKKSDKSLEQSLRNENSLFSADFESSLFPKDISLEESLMKKNGRNSIGIYDLFSNQDKDKEENDSIGVKSDKPHAHASENKLPAFEEVKSVPLSKSEISEFSEGPPSYLKAAFDEEELEFPEETFVRLLLECENEILKCRKFCLFIEKLAESLQRNFKQEAEVLIFVLWKWKFLIFLPTLKRLIKQQDDPKIRSIKWKILQYLSKNRGYLPTEEVFQEIVTWGNDLGVELLRDNIPEQKSFYEKMGEVLFPIMNRIREEVKAEKEGSLEKLFIYQDLCLLLSAERFFKDISCPFDMKKLERKRKKVKVEKLKEELRLN